MHCIEPNWSAPDHIRALTTTRQGGVSQGRYDSMNLAMHVTDDPRSVIENRRILRSELGLKSEPVWLDQQHSNIVLNADCALSEVADGSFTKSTNVVCSVMTADCLPLLLTNRIGDQVAAIHVGWRGMVNGIIANAVKTFECDSEEIIAWAGPCIGPNKFEIGPEVKKQLGGETACFKPTLNGKYLADLVLLCQRQLALLGVESFTHSAACTHSDESLFYSFRRDGQCGRMATLIWIDQ